MHTKVQVHPTSSSKQLEFMMASGPPGVNPLLYEWKRDDGKNTGRTCWTHTSTSDSTTKPKPVTHLETDSTGTFHVHMRVDFLELTKIDTIEQQFESK
mmetsp:Transcript_818/g.1862  ORF Transcript_818/g.1862 Transcript_818/m.1862 type:complete len:98 (-) Transcript_818:3-296(-)